VSNYNLSVLVDAFSTKTKLRVYQDQTSNFTQICQRQRQRRYICAYYDL
jgi:hypothetical protein